MPLELESEKILTPDSSPGLHPPSRNATGPRTEEGKAASSMNALKHGCRSAKTILRHEDPAEFEALVAGWFDRYHPQDPVAATLVEETARAHWFLRRARKRLEDVEWELPANAYHWTDEHQRLLTNFHRYKTSAERSFLRFYRELEMYYRRLEKNKAALSQAAFSAMHAIEVKASAAVCPQCGKPRLNPCAHSADSAHDAEITGDPLGAPTHPCTSPPLAGFVLPPTFVEPEVET